MRALGVEVLYYGGYGHEAGLIIRQAKEHGYSLQLVAGDGLSNQDFGLVAGAASDGTRMTSYPSPSGPRGGQGRRQVRGGRESGLRFVRGGAGLGRRGRAGRDGRGRQVADALRTHRFETVLGRIGFDAKGDVTGYKTFVWYVWQGGKYVAKEVVN